MASPGHRANIMGTRWDGSGVGVVKSGGYLWVTEIFRETSLTCAQRNQLPPRGAQDARRRARENVTTPSPAAGLRMEDTFRAER